MPERSVAAAVETPVAVEVTGVSKRFGSLLALDAVDLSVARGSFVTLLGPSGCGKTTLLRLIGGFEAPSAGTVRVDGRPIAQTPLKERSTRMVFQSYALFPHMSVGQNVGYGLRMAKVARAEIARRVADMLALVGIPDRAAAYPAQLSGGQQQRVALARALVTRPSVLLLDEPLSALDLKMRRRMQVELKALQKELGITFVFVTHDQEEALTLSDRVVVMENGRIAQEGTPEDVYHRPASPYVADFVGETNLLRSEGLGTSGSSEPHTLAIRPEKVRLTPRGGIGVAATVTDISFLGGVWRTSFRLPDGQVVRADLGERPPAPGETARISWDAADAVVFPAVSPSPSPISLRTTP